MTKIWAFVLLIFVSIVPNIAHAGSGSSYLVHWQGAVPSTGTNQYTIISLTNITSHTLNVGVTFYQSNGSTTTSGVTYTNFVTSNTQLAAGTTGQVTIQPSTYQFGYAVINWSNSGTDNDTVGLIADGQFNQIYSSSADTVSEMPINRGSPF